MPNIKDQLENEIMSEIKSGRVKLRSKYIFLAEKFSLSSAFALIVLLAVLVFNLVLFYLKSSDNLAYLSFGNGGVFAFLESFPYLLVASFVVLIFIAGLIIKTSNFAYTKPFGYLALGLVLFVMVGGIILTFTNIAENLEQQTYDSKMGSFIFKPFLTHAFDIRNKGMVGRIVEIGSGFLVVQTPHGSERLIMNSGAILPLQPLSEGTFIMAIGSRDNGDFNISKLQIINPEEMKMIQRGVHRRFGQFQPRHEIIKNLP